MAFIRSDTREIKSQDKWSPIEIQTEKTVMPLRP
jgi:hypothetical protein